MKRPNTRVTLHAGTPAALRRELGDFLHALNPTDQVAITIAVTPPDTATAVKRDTRGAPSKPGPA